MRPTYHVSVPDNWKNDPQRPIYLDGEYHYYYLYNADYIEGRIGTSWRRATTRDHVTFEDRGVAIPKSGGNGDCWSGCLVVDENDTAGFGVGAVVALITQAPRGVQAQYLWYSTDGGATFASAGDEPVLANPGVPDFRDPKVIRDTDRDRWVMVNAEGFELGFYISTDLRSWTKVGRFERTDIGLLECPDIFRMTADDGTRHWILATSANGKERGLPATYAYWTGEFDGESFIPDRPEPEWLDYGFDFYGAVTYPHHDDAGRETDTLRRALGWANFWDYPHNTPTLVTDGYNGDDMIVRDVRLVADAGTYFLASTPTAALDEYVVDTRVFGDVEVADVFDLDTGSLASDITCEITWDAASAPDAVGFDVCRAPAGGRFVRAEISLADHSVRVDRRNTISPSGGETRTSVEVGSAATTIRILVDRTSVEVFFGQGRVVHSHRVFPLEGDTHLRLYARGGRAVFRNLTVSTLGGEAHPRQ